ncbi:unnamed protein product [Hapterophycus canaliculatus]
MYDSNREEQELLEEAVSMRRAVSSDMGRLEGTTFVHDSGQTGIVSNVFEKWAFTLEVELDKLELRSNSCAKIYLPIETLSTPDSLVGVAEVGDTGASGRCASDIHALSIPWSAQVVKRIRLESAELVRVDGLVGARVSGTLLGGGRVTTLRNVSVRCEIETVVSDGSLDGTVVASS